MKKKIGIIGANSFLAMNFLKYSQSEYPYEYKLYDYVENPCGINIEVVNYEDVEDICKVIDFNVNYLLIFMGKTGTISGFEEYEQFIRINEIYLLNILSAYVRSKSRAYIIYPSSRLIYRESYKLIDEYSAIQLKTIYAVTKYASEQYLKIYKECFDVKYVIIHICTTIGSLLENNGTYGTFKIFEEQADNTGKITLFGDGLQRKTFTHITDICLALNKLIQADSIKYTSYNLGGNDLSLLEIAESISKRKGVLVEHVEWPEIYKKIDGGNVVFDSSRFDEEFNMVYCPLI